MVSDNIFFMYPIKKKTNEYDHEIPQSHSADQPTAYVTIRTGGGTICGPMGII